MKICYVLIKDMLGTSLTWPSEMWNSAEQFANSLDIKFRQKNKVDEQTIRAHIQAITIAENLNPIETHAGLSLTPNTQFIDSIEEQFVYDLIYIPALWRNPYKLMAKSKALFDWLQFQYENGSTICGVGTGVCLIAETGLLDHRPATTHWYFFNQFQKRYPNIDLKRQHFITTAEPFFCAASINSLADLTIFFIQRYFGQQTAQHIERHFSHEIRRAYDRTSFMDKRNQNHPDESILQAQLWMRDNLIDAISIDKLSKKYGMSTRNFSRRFQAATSLSPNQYLQNLRIETAQDLLQYSNLSIAEVAERTGFNDLSYFAKSFKRQRSITPSEFRKTVRAKLFTNTIA